jgi:hypothetical protein
MMKTLTIAFSMMMFLTLNSYGQDKKITNLLEKEKSRTEIFNAILNNRELMMDFMQAMKGNEQAMTMMKENNQMMGMGNNMETGNHSKMMDHNKMMSMMKENPEMMQKMMANMMDKCEMDSAMCSNMANMMTDHPKMMKMCMQKMKEKGMMGTDGTMKMINTGNQPNKTEHSEHH